MPMNEEVRKAVERSDAISGTMLIYQEHDDYELIRAELHRLTEIADSVDPLVVRLGEVTEKLERAEEDAATEREIQNAADKFPEGFIITLYVENGSGYIDLAGPDGDPVEVNTSDLNMAEQFAEATRVAIQAHLSEPRT